MSEVGATLWGEMSRSKRHHFVPRAYLERFAEAGQVQVRHRDGNSYRANCVNVAVECGFYDVRDTSGDKSGAVEELLAEMEGAAVEALRSVDETGRPPLEGTPERSILATYMALQATRTPEERERILFPRHVAEYVGSREITEPLMAEYLEDVHLGFKPSEEEVRAALDFVSVTLRDHALLTPEFAIEMMLRSIGSAAPVLDGLHWTLESTRKGRFITSDVPLVVWRAPSPRDQFEGVGIGNAEEIRFPLDPTRQLVLTRLKRTPTARVDADRARACNVSMAEACHRFLVSHPAQSKQMKRLALTAKRPVLRFNTGPLYEVQSDGSKSYKGEVLHTWVPRR